MWIVRIALSRPYTFIVLALLILLVSPLVILRTPTDIFPNIDIPVLASIWNFGGLSAEDMEGRITTGIERNMTTTVSDIEHIESLTLSGRAIIKLFLQPGASVDKANAEITSISNSSVRNLPPGAAPPFILTYNASTVPILQLALSSPTLPESQLQDLGQNFVRTQLVTVPGAELPYPYGGKQRQINVALNTAALQAKGLSPNDVVTALGNQNVVLPAGTAKIGQFEYDVDLNSAPERVEELNDLPIKQVGNSTIYIRDVATVSDGFAPQTNIVRLDGQRGSLITILKNGDASTLDVVQGVKDLLPSIQKTLPPDLKIQELADQSFFVRAAISGVVREAVIAACLTGLMILIFLGSWRSTLIIAVSIPLSILVSICALSALHETINIMTLGGLALAVGILVDDATVTIENIERYLEEGHDLHTAILEGAAQIAVPALVSTLCICIVFLPMFFLSGVSKYLFVPLAEAVVFAMIASYLLSRTLIPTLALYLLKPPAPGESRSRNPLVLFQRAFEHGFERLRVFYRTLLEGLVHRRVIFIPCFLGLCLSGGMLIPWLGQDFFPTTDNGQFMLHVRTKTGTRIEETARLCDLVENSIRSEVPANELDNILDNIGLPYSSINYLHGSSGVLGASEADVLVSLHEKHHPTAEYMATLRNKLPAEFPGTTFYFLPADMVTQILNFGLPAPIDVQIEGADVATNRNVADQVLEQFRHVPGLTDLRIQQTFDYPKFHITVDRTKAQQGGFSQRDIATGLLISLSGSFQTAPIFFLNEHNGVNYSLVTQTPQYAIQSLTDLQNVPVSGPGMIHPEILADVAAIDRSNEMEALSHYNIRRVVDIYGSVQGRDLGGVGRDVSRIVKANEHLLPRGAFFRIRGQLDTMRTSYVGLFAGLGFSIVLVYMLIVVNFQSWL
ncbi:MAG TPA: efflux RND transporter permease subunit, partial [Bryobacteraceae bacterium]|nr:efflux RND transporter permease subunit [Bryobacteraceae bacterium]